MRAKHLAPNAVTLANIALGCCAMIAAADGRYERACVLLFFAAMCDLLDGRLARWLNAASAFGRELDSLSDAVSFGVAPALLVYLSVLRPLGTLGAAVAIGYALCGALRLARYNVDTTTRVSFQGVPIPVANGYMISFVLVRGSVSPWLIAVGTAYIAACMVATVRIPKFRGDLPFAFLPIGLGLFVAFLARPIALTWHLWNGFNFFLVGLNYVVLARRGQLKRTPDDLPRAA